MLLYVMDRNVKCRKDGERWIQIEGTEERETDMADNIG
jgi:hypothetical protein